MIDIQLSSKSNLKNTDFNNLGFGKIFTDHMLVADYFDGNWQTVNIIPYQPLVLDPSACCFHYGQEIFEGLKAFKHSDGKISIFRPDQNAERFNNSALRMGMPEIPKEIFIDGLCQLVKIDQNWIPTAEGTSLYIRPFMIATENILGVHSSKQYKFIIILSPVGSYFSVPKPLHIIIEEHYARAVKGGTGNAKNAGNYGATLLPTNLANKHGFDQILWIDYQKNIQEVGMMNVMFKINNEIHTPSLSHGTILDGITRKSIIQLVKDMGIPIFERDINISEIFEASQNGTLQEMFGTGTAAVILQIEKLTYQDKTITLNIDTFKTSSALKQTLINIQTGAKKDTHGWLTYI
ncbi:MAG: branched-chain amino acid aminotransferase [Alphaproteobacteria bacterium]|nr:branched-chain amino acid aminotransferase [Alphaproteobacteria bacterium]